LTRIIHTDSNFRNVGMIEVLNEPMQGAPSSLVTEYYPTAYSKIRATENSLNIGPWDLLHIQFMNQAWGSGNPKQSLSNQWFAAYDSHRYLKWDSSVPQDQGAYIRTSCQDNVAWDGDTPLIVGEWSLGTPNPPNQVEIWPVSSNLDFYKKWWAAQVLAYERQQGWVFWAWKVEEVGWQANNPKWGYKNAVQAGIIPKDPTAAARMSPC
jgi:hypothetical protein